MAQKNIAIYITSETISICIIKKSGGNLIVERVFSVETPSDSVEDGLITEIESVAVAISDVLRQNKIKRGKLIFTVYSRKIANKEIELPFIKNAKKIEEMIEANVEDYFPMSNMQEYIIRYAILDTVEAEKRKFYKLSVVAVQKELVNSYYELAKMLKMPVETIDYQGNSLYNLLLKQVKTGIALVLQMDKDALYVTIMNGQAQLFRRSIPFGSDSLIQAFATMKELEEEEAAGIMRDPQLLEEYLSEEEYTEIVTDMSSAITRVVEFYTVKNPSMVIEYAKMYGAGTELQGVELVLGKELGVEIEAVKHLNGVSIKKKNKYGLTYNDLSGYLANIGAMIHSLDIKIEDERKKKRGGGYGIFYILIAVSALALISFSVFVYIRSVKLKEEKATLETWVDKLKPAEDIYNSYVNVQNYLDTVKTFENNTKNDNEALYQLVLTLEQIMPETVGIINLDTKNGEININATSSGKEPIAKFVIALKEVPYISNVRVKDIRDTYDDFGGVTSVFNMSFRIHLLAEETESVEGGEQ